jgi:hypothetical protein
LKKLKGKKGDEQKRVFQDVWSVKFPQVKSMGDEQKKVHKIKCKIYTKIEGKEKLLAIKLDNLYKHPIKVGRSYK